MAHLILGQGAPTADSAEELMRGLDFSPVTLQKMRKRILIDLVLGYCKQTLL